ncbi:MAG: leucyl aminopeptidase, partial [Burkholderiales bacterium]|nr:leucyl aminopeptidase [Burkholderiales bacterium]
MEFSTTTSASLHTLKTQALAVGVFQDGVLSPAADALDQASNGAIRAVVKAEFDAAPGGILTLHAPAGIAAERVILLGLGAQDRLPAATLARAHETLAAYCVRAGVGHAVSTLCALPCADADVADCARAAARLVSAATYRYDATFSQSKPAAKLRA